MHTKGNPKVKTEWDLSLLYKSLRDPQIEKDVEEYGKLCDQFAKKYKGKKEYLASESALARALADYEKIIESTKASKPLHYLFYLTDLNGDNSEAQAKNTKLTSLVMEHENKLVFFEVAFKGVSGPQQKKFLKSPKLARYRYLLKLIFDRNKHVLSEPEEKILNLKHQPAHIMWENAGSKLSQRQTVEWKGKTLPFAEARNLVQNLPLKERRELYEKVIRVNKERLSDFAEAELNALVTDKKIDDKLRGYDRPYSSTVRKYQNDPETVEHLVKAVTDNFAVSRRFYKLKTKLLGLKKLEVADINASLGTIAKKIPFEEALQTVETVFRSIDPEFGSYVREMFEKGCVDVYPRKGKRGGAYSSSAIGQPSYILLNHVPDFNSLMTLAHEMGHSLHSHYSKSQPAIYEHYSGAAAEVASTLFEKFVFESVFETLSDKEKVIALHNEIGDNISTIFRQIACFNFEVDLHTSIREKGELTKEEMAEMMAKHLGSYLGPAVNVTTDSGYTYASWPHLRYFFYVYTYAYGALISNALYRKYKENPEYIREIKKFLSAGGSASPEDIFQSIGIDTRDPKFWEAGLREIEENIDRLQRLTK